METPQIYKMIRVRCCQQPERTKLVRTLIDTGNTLNSPAVISETFHEALGAGFQHRKPKEIGTAKEGAKMMRVGRSNPIELQIGGIREKIVISPSVIRGLTDQMNIGVNLLHQLGKRQPTSITFSEGSTTLVVGEDTSRHQ